MGDPPFVGNSGPPVPLAACLPSISGCPVCCSQAASDENGRGVVTLAPSANGVAENGPSSTLRKGVDEAISTCTQESTPPEKQHWLAGFS